jgi:hypothetical protein
LKNIREYLRVIQERVRSSLGVPRFLLLHRHLQPNCDEAVLRLHLLSGYLEIMYEE